MTEPRTNFGPPSAVPDYAGVRTLTHPAPGGAPQAPGNGLGPVNGQGPTHAANQAAGTAPMAAPPADYAGVQTELTIARDQNQASLRETAQQLVTVQGQLDAALKAGDVGQAQELVMKAINLTLHGQMMSTDPELNAFFAKAEQSLKTASEELAKYPSSISQQFKAEEAPPKKKNEGPLGFLGKAVGAVGKVVEGAARIVTAPLELVGKVLDPVREAVGGALGGLKDAIDGSLGKIPVLGAGVRFTTGLASSVVGMVDGAVQAVTHPVDTLKALGGVAWDVAGVVPPFLNPKTLYDVAVNGMNPMESFSDSLGGVKDLGTAFFSGALEDLKDGNVAGALGRVTGDIGSFVVTGGASGAAKAGATGGKLSQLSARASQLAGAVRTSSAGVKAAELATAARAAGVGQKAASLAQRAHLDDVGQAYRARAVQGIDTAARGSFKVVEQAARLQRPWMGFIDNWAQKLPLIQRIYNPAREAAVRHGAPVAKKVGEQVAKLELTDAAVGNIVGRTGATAEALQKEEE